jgi:hypothetical protein
MFFGRGMEMKGGRCKGGREEGNKNKVIGRGEKKK